MRKSPKPDKILGNQSFATTEYKVTVRVFCQVFSTRYNRANLLSVCTVLNGMVLFVYRILVPVARRRPMNIVAIARIF